MAEKKGKGTQKVYALSRASRCYNCDRKLAAGEIVRLQSGNEETEVLCRTCAQLDSLEVLPSGNAAITRLAAKYSPVSFTVLRWSELWKCYERLGILVSPESIDRAEQDTGTKLTSSR